MRNLAYGSNLAIRAQLITFTSLGPVHIANMSQT